MRVLLVEDEPKVRRGVQQLIRRFGEGIDEVRTASSAEKALEQAEEAHPDLLMVDIRMPGMDGLELAEQLQESYTSLLTIVITGYDRFSYARRAIDLGVFGFLLKPVREEELRDLLAKAGAALKEQHRRSTLTAWSDRELSARLTEHRNRFFRHCLLGEVTEDQIVVQQQALTMPAGTVGQLYGLCTTKVRGTGDISIQGFHPGSKEYRRILREQLKKDDENEPDLLLETELDELSLFLSLYYPGRKFSEQLPEELSKQLPSGCRVDMIHFPGEWHKLSKLYRYLYERITACGECSPAVVDALKMIERRYDDPDFSLREASGWLRVSPSYLSKLVKEHTGLSFVDYLLQYRLDRAADELESSEPDVKVYEIAEHNGFRSHHYFTRQFRRRSGFTPREYRKQYYASS